MKSARWGQLRANQLAREPFCKFCLEDGKRTKAEVADHREPHRGDSKLFFDAGNLQSLCKLHHDSTKQRLERSGVLCGCDERGFPLSEDHHWNKGRA